MHLSLKTAKEKIPPLIFLTIFLFVYFSVRPAGSELCFENCLDQSYVITFPLTLRNGNIINLESIKDKKLGCVDKSIHRMHAENILRCNGNVDEAYDLSQVPLKKAIGKLEKNELSVIFFTTSLNDFKNTPFYKRTNIKILSLSKYLMEELRNRYTGFSYDYLTCISSRITGNIHDNQETNLLVSPTVHARLDDHLNIGVLLPLTGKYAKVGSDIYKGIETVSKMVPALFGQRVNLFIEDHESDVELIAKAVERLIKQKKVCGIIGSATNSFTFAALDIAERFRVPLIAPSSSDPHLTDKYRYAFRVCTTDSFKAKVAADYAFNYLNARKAAIMIDTDEKYSKVMARSFSEKMKKLGGEVAVVTHLKGGVSDFTPQILSIKAKQADFVYAPIPPWECEVFSKQAREMGMDIPIVYDSLPVDHPKFCHAGAPKEGFVVGGFHPKFVETKFAERFLTLSEKITGARADELSALGADSYLLLIDAISRANSTKPPLIREALANTVRFKGITGTFRVGQDGNAIKNVVIMQIKKGKIRPIATIPPREIAPFRPIQSPPYSIQPIPKEVKPSWGPNTVSEGVAPDQESIRHIPEAVEPPTEPIPSPETH